MWFAYVAAAAPLSVGGWVSEPTLLADRSFGAGAPDGGWLLVANHSYEAPSVLRVAADGSLDPAAIDLGAAQAVDLVTWTGSDFALVGSSYVYPYGPPAVIQAFRVPLAGPAQAQILADDLPSAGEFVGACVGDHCSVAMIAGGVGAARMTFDLGAPGGAIAPVPDLDDVGFGRGVRDGDSTAVIVTDGLEQEVVWFPDDLAAPIERVPITSPRVLDAHHLAASRDGTLLHVWLAQEGGPGDSGHPNDDGRVLAERVQRGVGVLDASPIDLGATSVYTELGVAWDGANFVVTVESDDADVYQLHRIGVDGSLAEAIEVEQLLGGIPREDLLLGADGHLLWLCPSYPAYQVLEIDVPDGGACHVSESCLSGSCVDEVCAPPAPAAPASAAPPQAKGCGCASGSPELAPWLALLALGAARRARR